MKPFVLEIAAAAGAIALVACSGELDGPDPADSLAASCIRSSDATGEIADAKLLFEFNSTDNDTGVHELFDTAGFAELCVFGPNGRQILAVQPQMQLRDLGMGGVFFESREPIEPEVSQAEILARFPPGTYEIVAASVDGETLAGSATLSHDIPEAPLIASPADGETVDPDNLVVIWEPVMRTINGSPATITGYEVIVTNEEVEDPNGFSQPILSAHVSASVTSLMIPAEFLESDVEYELEVIALEVSGNQTISIVFFKTE